MVFGGGKKVFHTSHLRSQAPSPAATHSFSHFSWSRAALLAYDYALTFSMEVERFWFSRKFSTTTALYFANRYIGLVGYAPILYQFLGAPGEDVRYSILTLHFASHLALLHLQE